MGKSNFLQKKYEEINKLKNMIPNYSEEYKLVIVKSINKISDEIIEYLEKSKKKDTNKNRYVIKKNLELTLDQLAYFNGLEDRCAYVAIDGTIYDVTPIKSWLNGNHYGLKAGCDLSEYFKSCHDKERELLRKLRIVGTIKE